MSQTFWIWTHSSITTTSVWPIFSLIGTSVEALWVWPGWPALPVCPLPPFNPLESPQVLCFMFIFIFKWILKNKFWLIFWLIALISQIIGPKIMNYFQWIICEHNPSLPSVFPNVLQSHSHKEYWLEVVLKISPNFLNVYLNFYYPLMYWMLISKLRFQSLIIGALILHNTYTTHSTVSLSHSLSIQNLHYL